MAQGLKSGLPEDPKKKKKKKMSIFKSRPTTMKDIQKGQSYSVPVLKKLLKKKLKERQKMLEDTSN